MKSRLTTYKKCRGRLVSLARSSALWMVDRLVGPPRMAHTMVDILLLLQRLWRSARPTAAIHVEGKERDGFGFDHHKSLSAGKFTL
jgi:hypothetical protein